MRKEASYYITLKDKKVKCTLCPHTCVISNGQRGVCGVRENQQGVLITLVYDHPCAINIDPIEKKPLNHFLPGSVSLSIGTAGCNLSCMYCQNWNMSKALPENIRCYTTTSDEILEMAKNSECASISYTYNEPSMNFEFVLEAARKAHTHRLKNVMVTNGFINQKPLKELYQYIDAANVDLKGFNQQFYKEICGASLNPVLESIKTMREMHIWLEITNLIIPTYNDNQDDIKKACQWLVENIGDEYPLHFSAYHPAYRLQNVPPTPLSLLQKAREIAQAAGVKYVYLGNVAEDNVTRCPNCHKELVKRSYFHTSQVSIEGGHCSCGYPIAGVWEV